MPLAVGQSIRVVDGLNVTIGYTYVNSVFQIIAWCGTSPLIRIASMQHLQGVEARIHESVRGLEARFDEFGKELRQIVVTAKE